MAERVNYITPDGYRRLREEYEALFGGERPSCWRRSPGPRRTATGRKMPIINMAAGACARWTGGSTSSPGG